MKWTKGVPIRTRWCIPHDLFKDGDWWFDTVTVSGSLPRGSRGEWWYEMDEETPYGNAYLPLQKGG